MDGVQGGAISWESLPIEICFKIFGNLPLKEQIALSTTSKLWYEIFVCNAFSKKQIENIDASVIEILKSTDYLTLSRLFPNSCYALPKPDPNKLITEFVVENIKIFDHGKQYEIVLKDMINTCELEVPCVHVWKALPPHNFVIITAIYIGVIGKERNGPETIATTLNFFSPSEAIPFEADLANEIEFPVSNMRSFSRHPYYISAESSFLPMNLNPKSRFEICFNLTNAFSEVEKLCKARINTLIGSQKV